METYYRTLYPFLYRSREVVHRNATGGEVETVEPVLKHGDFGGREPSATSANTGGASGTVGLLLNARGR